MRRGPWGWENTRAWNAGGQPVGTLEVTCYVDRRDFDICASAGPYSVISTPDDYDSWFEPAHQIRPGLILRIKQFIEPEDPDSYIDFSWEQRDRSNRHGGDAGQELAALVSLALGVRAKASGITRSFDTKAGSDPFGYPINPGPPPLLSTVTDRPILPYLADLTGRSIDNARVDLLGSYHKLSRKQALALVRAARSYQEATWIADSDPRQSWLRLVTAAESIAQLTQTESTVDALRRAEPEITEWAIRAGDESVVARLVELLIDQKRITAKFLKLFADFGPPPPDRRPQGATRMKWSSLEQELRLVYSIRSKDLHTGLPIPNAMCRPPYASPRSSIADEKTVVASAIEEDSTMTLQMFEYLVRHTILNWWQQTAAGA